MADDGYTRQIFQWQQQILTDGELTPLAVKIALALCRFINRQSRRAWPSQGTLAGLIHESRAGTQNALYQLAERGHLETTVNRGRGRSNSYRPAVHNIEQQSENAYSSRHFNSENAYASRQGVPKKNHLKSLRRRRPKTKQPTKRRKQHLRNGTDFSQS